MLLVRDVMRREVAPIDVDATVAEAARRMDELGAGALPVCDGDVPVGMLTDRDITVRATAAGYDPEVAHVRDAMTPDRDDDPRPRRPRPRRLGACVARHRHWVAACARRVRPPCPSGEAVADEIELDVVLEPGLHAGEHEGEASGRADLLPGDRLLVAGEARVGDGDEGGVVGPGHERPFDRGLCSAVVGRPPHHDPAVLVDRVDVDVGRLAVHLPLPAYPLAGQPRVQDVVEVGLAQLAVEGGQGVPQHDRQLAERLVGRIGERR